MDGTNFVLGNLLAQALGNPDAAVRAGAVAGFVPGPIGLFAAIKIAQDMPPPHLLSVSTTHPGGGETTGTPSSIGSAEAAQIAAAATEAAHALTSMADTAQQVGRAVVERPAPPTLGAAPASVTEAAPAAPTASGARPEGTANPTRKP